MQDICIKTAFNPRYKQEENKTVYRCTNQKLTSIQALKHSIEQPMCFKSSVIGIRGPHSKHLSLNWWITAFMILIKSSEKKAISEAATVHSQKYLRTFALFQDLPIPYSLGTNPKGHQFINYQGQRRTRLLTDSGKTDTPCCLGQPRHTLSQPNFFRGDKAPRNKEANNHTIWCGL